MKMTKPDTGDDAYTRMINQRSPAVWARYRLAMLRFWSLVFSDTNLRLERNGYDRFDARCRLSSKVRERVDRELVEPRTTVVEAVDTLAAISTMVDHVDEFHPQEHGLALADARLSGAARPHLVELEEAHAALQDLRPRGHG